MDEEYAYRAPARRFFVFVRPASVVGQRLAFEELGIVRGWLVHQHEQHFPAHVRVFVVVPVVLWGMNAVADVNDGRVDVGLRLLRLVIRDVVVEDLQGHPRPACWDERKRRFLRRRDTDHRDLLQIGPVVTRRLQTVKRKLGCDVFCGDISPTLPGTTSLEQVVR